MVSSLLCVPSSCKGLTENRTDTACSWWLLANLSHDLQQNIPSLRLSILLGKMGRLCIESTQPDTGTES